MTRPPNFSAGGSKDRNYLFSIYGSEGDLLRRPTGCRLITTATSTSANTGKRASHHAFDSSGKFVATVIATRGKARRQIREPISVAVAPDGRSYVVDKGLSKIVEYDMTHKPVKDIVFKDEAPLYVRVHDNQLFVTTPSGIVIGDLDGNFQVGYIKRGKGAGEFNMPGSVAVGNDGRRGRQLELPRAGTRHQRQGQSGTGASIPALRPYSGPDRKFGLPSSAVVDGDGSSTSSTAFPATSSCWIAQASSSRRLATSDTPTARFSTTRMASTTPTAGSSPTSSTTTWRLFGSDEPLAHGHRGAVLAVGTPAAVDPARTAAVPAAPPPQRRGCPVVR